MKLRSAVLLQQFLLTFLALSLTGITFIYINYNFLINREVESLFREADKLEMDLMDRTRFIPSNERFSQEVIIETLRSEMYETLSFYYNWGISFNFVSQGNYLFNRFRLDENDDELKQALNGRDIWVLRRDYDKLILRVAIPVDTEIPRTALYMEKNISSIEEHKYKLFQYLFYILSALFLLLIPMAVFFSRFITKPLTDFLKQILHFRSDLQIPSRSKTGIKEIDTLQFHFERLAHDTLAQMNSLKKESEAKEMFLSKLNHELNTPVTSIKGFADLLLSTPYDREIFEKALTHIQKESLRISHLNKNLQSLILPSKDYRWEQIDLNKSLEETLASLQYLSMEKEITYSIESIYKEVKANGALLHTLLKNILHNAIKASPPNGKIGIKVEESETQLKLLISDRGIGMSPLFLHEINQTNKSPTGGLGLAICYEILQHHNCSWTIESEVDKGTTIILDFTNLLHLDDMFISSIE